jgi:hypothetical protein
VASPELWRWSRFRAYFLGEAGLVSVNEWEVLMMNIRPPAALGAGFHEKREKWCTSSYFG